MHRKQIICFDLNLNLIIVCTIVIVEHILIKFVVHTLIKLTILNKSIQFKSRLKSLF